MQLYNLSISELKDKLTNDEITEKEIDEVYRKRIDNIDNKVQSFLRLTEMNENEKSKDDKLLNGIPVAIKDNMSLSDVETTCSSKILEGYKPPYNATVVNKLKDAGANIVGMTNMDEFAMGSSTENSAIQSTKNPWDLERVPGGSSGGSAAAVAAGEVPTALGSDTGGSIRQPAAFCGVVGLKPTYGLVSRYGLVAFASSLDQIGPFTRNVKDSALMMNVISGHDPKDSTSVDKEVPDYRNYLKEDVKGMKIGIPKEYFDLDIDEEVEENIREAINKLEKAGAIIEEVDLLSAEYSLAAYYIIAPAEASSNLARYDGVRYGMRSKKAKDVESMFKDTRTKGFGDEVKRRIMLGTYALSSGYYDAFYLKAQKVRTLIKEDFEKVFEEYDLLISPTTPSTAFKLDSEQTPLEMYQQDIFTVPVNIAGLPAISIPSGFDSKGLPIGLQMIGPHFGEGKILQAANTLEKILDLDLRPDNLEV
ncbi:MAG: Asp-tRNA(Asn)/Glu-tRNA(Gln) amidotransferase subunit GatA [Bacillota bacterium]